MSDAPRMSPINVQQDRAIGQDDPMEGSRMGREANKKKDYPGTPDIGTNAAQIVEDGEALPQSDSD